MTLCNDEELIPVQTIIDPNTPDGWVMLKHLDGDYIGIRVTHNINTVWKISMTEEEKFQYRIEQ